MFSSVRSIRTEPSLPFLAWLAFCLAALVLLVMPAGTLAAGTAYVPGGGVISQYAIDDDGRLSPLSPPSVPDRAGDIVVAPKGRSAYAIGGGGVLQYSVDPLTGALSRMTPPAVPKPLGSLGARDIAVTPNGRTVYITVGEPHGGSHIVGYDIHPSTGALSLSSAYAGCGEAFVQGEIAITPDSRSAYVTDIFGMASQCDIDPTTGAISPKSPGRIFTGRYAWHVAVTADGRSAYFGLNTQAPDNEIAQFDIDPHSGVLSPKTPAHVVTGPEVSFVITTPDSRSAYVGSYGLFTPPNGTPRPPNSGSIRQYDIDPVTGALSPKTPEVIATGGVPNKAVVTPDGNSAYVSNYAGSVLWQFDIDRTTGKLSQKTPATVPTVVPSGYIAVGPLPRVPTGKEQCARGGWRTFARFKNQGQCVAFVERRK